MTLLYNTLELEARQLSNYILAIDGDPFDDTNQSKCFEFLVHLDRLQEQGKIDLVEKSQLLDILN
jgi:hypothetical protein